ncbi:MAG: hypothetical protein AMK72_09060, partial [Planctomycetes bacterium SM23_25]
MTEYLVNYDGDLDFGGMVVTLDVRDGGAVDMRSGNVLNAGSASLAIEANSVAVFASGFDPYAVFGSYTCAGITHFAGSTLTIPAGHNAVLRLKYSDRVVCAGSLKPLPDSFLDLDGGLEVLPDGFVDLGTAGQLYIHDDTSGMSGGQLFARLTYIGGQTGACFTQTAGTHTVALSVWIGRYGGTGSYALSGTGALSAQDE